MSLLEEILAIENDGWRALCDGTAATFYPRLMTDDAVMVLADGSVMDRHTVARALSQAPPWRTYQLSDHRVIDAGDVVVLVYLGTAYRKGEDEPFVAAMSSVYRRVEDTWRLVLYQQTAVA